MMQHAFDKIKVIELGGYIAGAFCATLLADLGAEVIKVESLQGDGLRGLLGSFQNWNRGKQGIAVDLRSIKGQVILHKLVRQSDVLVQNLRPAVSQRWGADYATLSGINPRLIYCSMPGYGESGPYIDKPSFDPIFQSRSGAMSAQGGSGNPPVFHRIAICDYAGAMLGAYGVATALYLRAKTGKGQRLNLPLMNAAIAIQSGEFVAYRDKPDEEPRMEPLGINATYRLYKAHDSWFFLGCRDESLWPALCRALDKDKLINDPKFKSLAERQNNALQLAQILETVFTSDSRQHWLDRLEQAGIPCAPAYYSLELFDHPHIQHNELMAEHDSAQLGKVKQLGMIIKLSKTPGKLWRAAPALGQHTDEILSELGYPTDEIQELRSKRIIA